LQAVVGDSDTRTLDLSLVVCTHNRAQRLVDCLDAVDRIDSARAWEIIVVDNASDDDTAAVVRQAAARMRAPLRLVHEPRVGVSRARNLGWHTASGSIVSYVDDDCYPAPDFVDHIVHRFEQDHALGYLGGAVLPYDESDALVTYVVDPSSIDIPSRGFVTPGLMICANLAFRREALERIGGFDVAFGYGAGFPGGVDAVIEDLDAAARVSAAGWRGSYDPRVIVRHHHGRKPGPNVEGLKRGYDVGRGAFYAKAALDSQLRRTYLVGWARLTAGRVRRREHPRALGRELVGAARYLVSRAVGHGPRSHGAQ
jgi:glycosyltransferase involved in cell wall biosynthesis